MRHSLLICIFILIIPLAVHAQNCGLSDTIFIQNNSSSTIDFTISDYFNDDLADPMQGLCGVELHFLHQFSENLELSLTSPAGQTIDLIGPNTDDPFAFTFFTKWKITFVPCGTTAQPDLGYLSQWDNDQPNNFVSGGQYDGTYYPYNGCLEDFNTGPVNGQWTFNVDNNPSDYPGAFVFIRLIFCDSRGVDCCFAVPGEIEDPDLLTCEGDSTLIFVPELFFATGAADTSEYGYQFTIFENDTLIAYDTTMNLLNYPAGEYEVCGLSYRLIEQDSLPPADGTLPLDVFRDSLNSLTPWFCGLLTDSCMSINIVATPDPVFFEQTICAGDSIMVGDTTLYEEALHTITLLNYAGCDSIVNVNLQLQQPPVIDLDSIICQDDSVQIGTSVYFDTGIFSDTLQTFELGCDSIVNLNLTVLQPIFVDTIVTICAADSFVVGDSIFTMAGNYTVPMISAAGCDSTVNLTLNILEVTASVSDPDTINCYNNSIFLDGSNSQPFGPLSYDWYSLSGDYEGSGLLLPVDQAGTYYLEVSATQDMATCFSRDTVVVVADLNPPIADAGLPDTITCFQSTATLGGINTSMGPDITYTWSTDFGNILSANDIAAPVVDGAGIYTLVVQDEGNGCSDTSMVQIELDTLAPVAAAGGGFVINCQTLSGNLNAAGSSTGPAYDLSWAGPCIETLATEPEIEVSCAGMYLLEIQNIENGCLAADSVEVTGNHIAPTALIADADTITCLQEQVLLEGSSSIPPDSLSFEWSGSGIISAADQEDVLVNLEGNYTLIVTNIYNFCQDTASIVVAIDTIHPVADAGSDGILTCNDPILPLGGPTTSLGPEFIYNWVTSDGHFTEPLGGPFTAADSSGVYQLEVIDQINGCRDTSIVIFGADQQIPFADAGPDIAFVCGDDTLILDGSDSDTTQNLTVMWTGPCIETAPDELIVEISCAGTYFLSLIDIDSGCTGEDTVVVSTDPAALFAELPDTAMISCVTGEAFLNGSASSPGLYQWLLDGEPVALSGNSVLVSEPGFYQLIVSNFNQTCLDTAGIVVILDCDIEVSLSNTPGFISCGESIVQIAVEVSPANPVYEYNWEEPAPGCIIDGQGTTAVEVICAGSYTFFVNNPALGINDTLVVEINANEDVPIADAGLPDTITCLQEVVFLDGTGSSAGLDIVYFWTAANGDTLGNQSILQVNDAGIYFLEVVDTTNNCGAFDVVEVFVNNTPPDIVFGNAVFLCESDTFSLEAFITPMTGLYEFNWSGPGIIGVDSSVALIDTTGQYILEVENLLNGCTATDTVEVVEQICIPCLEILPPDTLTCTIDNIALQGQFCEPCVGCELEWTTIDGEILADTTTLTPLIGAPGIYNFSATDTLGYTTTVSVTVVGIFTPPEVDAGPNFSLTCDSLTVEVGGSGTVMGSEYTYAWSSLTGASIMPVDHAFATVSEPGVFVLEVVNTATGCIGVDTVLVSIDTLAPLANAGSDQLLTCQVELVNLDGSASSLGNNLTYFWEGPAGSCLSGENTLSPIAGCEGTYLLTVTNLINGCLDTSSVYVGIADDLPAIEPVQGGELNCITSGITLSGNSPLPTAEYSLSWCPLDDFGDPVLAECSDVMDTIVTTPGLYQFEVTEIATGCDNAVIVEVTQDTTAPVVDAGDDGTLLCNLNSLNLAGTVNLPVDSIIVTWTADSGQLIENPDQLDPTIYTAGTYYLEVTDTNNNCVASDSLVILLDENIPMVNAGPDTVLTCLVDMITLQGEAQTTGDDNAFAWSTEQGNIDSGSNTPMPVIDHPGVYYLTVTDNANGCMNIDSLQVIENIENPTAVIGSVGMLELTCDSDSLFVDASGSFSATGGALAFEWQVVEDGSLYGVLTSDGVGVDGAGTFLLQVMDMENGCLDSLTFEVAANAEFPVINYEQPLDLDCENEQVVIDATATDSVGMSLFWSTEEEGVILTDALSLLVFEPGIYMFTVVDQQNGCTETVDIFIDIDTLGPEVIIEPVSEVLDCENRAVKIDARNSSTGSIFTYNWTADPGLILSGQDSLVTFAGEPGFYTLGIINTENGCVDEATVEVLESAAPITGVVATIVDPGCLNISGGSITIDSVLGGTPSYLYALNGSSFSSTFSFSGLTAGFHELIVRDENDCEWTQSFLLLEPEELVVDLGPDIELVLGDSVAVEALVNREFYDTLFWMPAEAFDDPSNPVQVLNPEVTTAYTVFVEDDQGCTDTDVIIINLIKPREFFIPNAFSPANADGNNDIFMIFGGPEVKEIITFQVYDRWGNLVYENSNFQPNNPAFGWDGTLDGRLMNSAVFAYYVKIAFTDGWVEDVKGEIILMR
jgi:gliding motility-associated-like protein